MWYVQIARIYSIHSHRNGLWRLKRNIMTHRSKLFVDIFGEQKKIWYSNIRILSIVRNSLSQLLSPIRYTCFVLFFASVFNSKSYLCHELKNFRYRKSRFDMMIKWFLADDHSFLRSSRFFFSVNLLPMRMELAEKCVTTSELSDFNWRRFRNLHFWWKSLLCRHESTHLWKKNRIHSWFHFIL